jgi:hypothetical protein
MEKQGVNTDMYYVIRTFYERFRYNKNPHKKRTIPKKENVKIQKIYLRNTVFSNNRENTVKKMLVIHFYNNSALDTFRLSICYNDYIDIINRYNITI